MNLSLKAIKTFMFAIYFLVYRSQIMKNIHYTILHLIAGGPGSGKVTHCDNLMQEKKGIVHINMTDLLQQYAVGNGKH